MLSMASGNLGRRHPGLCLDDACTLKFTDAFIIQANRDRHSACDLAQRRRAAGVGAPAAPY